MGSQGNFFVVGKSQWEKACALGMNPAVGLLVLARGTGRDNATTSWSADAISRYTGISWRRAKKALQSLIDTELLACLKKGAKPRYQVAKPDEPEECIWLPNELITGAACETPPIARIRQTQELDMLQIFIGLYREHDLPGDGGLPRHLLLRPFSRSVIMEMGQFIIYGFDEQQGKGRPLGPLKRPARVKNKALWNPWMHLRMLEHLGLLEWINYLAEGEDTDSELVHPLTGDKEADVVAEAAARFAESLPEGFVFEAENYDYVLPVINHMQNAAVVGVARLRYRPKTTRTAAWFAKHTESCRAFTNLYTELADRNFSIAL